VANPLTSTLKCGTKSEESVTLFLATCWILWTEVCTGASPVRKFRSPHSSDTGPLELDNALFPGGTGNNTNSVLERGAILLTGSPKRGYLFLNYAVYYKFSGLRVLSTGSRGKRLDLTESSWQQCWRKWRMENLHNLYFLPRTWDVSWLFSSGRGAARTLAISYLGFPRHLHHAGFLLGLFFDPEDGGDKLFGSTGWLSTKYTALYYRRWLQAD
jgi:hypothetical protein